MIYTCRSVLSTIARYFFPRNVLKTYLSPSEEPIRITNTGSPSIFNGVPDWCYEEEIFSSDFTLFFSPSSTLLAYLSFDEAQVDTYSFPIYNPTFNNHEVVPYTQNINMKYPKPGYSNPIVSLHVFDVGAYRAAIESGGIPPKPSVMTMTLDWEGRHPANDSIIAARFAHNLAKVELARALGLAEQGIKKFIEVQ